MKLKLRRRILISHNFSEDCSGESASFQSRTRWDAVLCTPGNWPHASHTIRLCCTSTASGAGVVQGKRLEKPQSMRCGNAALCWEDFFSLLPVRAVSRRPLSFSYHLTTASICLCDQNSSAGNCSCEWQVCLRGFVRSPPPAALPVKSKCNFL